MPGLIANHGWRPVMLWLGVFFFVATMIAAQLLKNPPAGWSPPGWKPSPGSPSGSSGEDFSPGEMLGTSQFWRLLVAYALGASAGAHGD